MNRASRPMLAVRLRRGDAGVQQAVAAIDAANRRLDDHEYLDRLEAENIRLHALLREAQVVFPLLTDKTRRQELLKLVVADAAGEAFSRYEDFPDRVVAACEIRELRQRISLLENARQDILELPTDMPGVAALVAQLYAHRITFTDAALASAKAAQFQDVRVAWRLLRSMATTLFDLYGTGVDLEREFSNRTGFELALTESGATKAGAEIYRQRLVRHADRIIYAGGHVKFGNRAPRLLRVHFAFPPDSPRLLVTHCGDHLETAGSRRRS